nr:PREDICTED: uncharacterized protein LOC106705418 [Latimeria chalumnae]|eukprot:XP_014350308.1 PREDICTED: uncharacterized protein LOC106705418 [Latimeria chalumnae]
MVETLNTLQSNSPIAMKAYDYLEDLAINFSANRLLQYEACAVHFEKGDNLASEKSEHFTSNRYEQAEEKINKYMSSGQSAIKFLQQCRIFNPNRLAILLKEKSAYTDIPRF